MHKGFYLKSLAAIGKNVTQANVTFSKGLNIIQGASNTGKSYVFQCINYLLGSHATPKPIKESDGYSEIRLQINTYDGKYFTLSRKFNDNNIYLAEVEIDQFDNVETKRLSAQHSSKNEDNISYFLLNLIGLNGRKLKINDRNETREISFRDLIKLCLINEELIISETSPIYTGNFARKTTENSVFKLILSGKDDDELESLEDPKIYKNKIRGKLEFIEESIKNKSEILDKLTTTIEDLELEKINIMIDEFSNVINESHKNVIEEEKKRADIWGEIESIHSQIGQIDKLKERFQLLDKHYDSDLGRLEFINEGKQYIDQLIDVNCPICGSLIKQGVLEQYDEQSPDDVLKSLVAEAKSIQLKKKELLETIRELDKNRLLLNNNLNQKNDAFEKINSFIINKLKPAEELNRKNLDRFIKLKEDKSRIELLKEEVELLKKEKKYYSLKIEEKEEKPAERFIENKYYTQFSDKIMNILLNWGLSCKSIYYDKTENDIEIDGTQRKTFGKGFRAIYQSAFMIGLLKFCLDNNKNHPFFLVLDSPLTAYKEQDQEVNNSDQLPKDTQDLFYKNLAEYNKDSDAQILILENKEPPENVKNHINYIHFSGNERIGRYGFYPRK
ncbi:MAG: hypothetical protein WC307_05365 [Candidatus Nanoarchaeia archaeon]|jgi:hypothetical protein